jgi:peptide/nickel transport system permease protein
MTADALTATPAQVLPAAYSPFRRALARFRRHRLAMLGVTIIVAMGIMAIIAPESAAYEQHLGQGHQPPSAAHWFGTDALGRDVFARVMLGGRVSLVVGLVSALFATAIGMLVGSLAGFYRRADFAIMRVVDIIMSFPIFILLLLVAAFIGPGVENIIFLIAILTWPEPCRLIRGQFLQLREADYITAGQVIGLRDRSMVLRHIIPNAIGPMLVYVSLAVGANVILEAGLSFLGLGVQPPTPSWGNMLNVAHSITVLSREPWQWVPPAVMVVLFVLAVNFVGDGVRDALDARSTGDRA